MELLKYVYFCTHKSVIKAGNNKLQDLINVPRKCKNYVMCMSILLWIAQNVFKFI